MTLESIFMCGLAVNNSEQVDLRPLYQPKKIQPYKEVKIKPVRYNHICELNQTNQKQKELSE